MTRTVLLACLPWFACLIGLGLVACTLVWAAGGVRPARMRKLHADQRGSAQSLSFVLALPLFIMVLMLIVQVSQLMIGTIVVHYAAFAAVRSAVVWIPARWMPERENCIAGYGLDPDAPDQQPPALDPADLDYGPSDGGMYFLLERGGAKFEQIHRAAVLALLPIAPSRNLGLDMPPWAGRASEALGAATSDVAPRMHGNSAIGRRLRNKLAYADSHTDVEVRFFHSNAEPPLLSYYIGPDLEQFQFNELGWRDQITVTVRHDLALLPGPGRMLARVLRRRDGTDPVSERIASVGGVYTTRLSATATLSNEGEQSVVPYVHLPY